MPDFKKFIWIALVVGIIVITAVVTITLWETDPGGVDFELVAIIGLLTITTALIGAISSFFMQAIDPVYLRQRMKEIVDKEVGPKLERERARRELRNAETEATTSRRLLEDDAVVDSIMSSCRGLLSISEADKTDPDTTDRLKRIIERLAHTLVGCADKLIAYEEKALRLVLRQKGLSVDSEKSRDVRKSISDVVESGVITYAGNKYSKELKELVNQLCVYIEYVESETRTERNMREKVKIKIDLLRERGREDLMQVLYPPKITANNDWFAKKTINKRFKYVYDVIGEPYDVKGNIDFFTPNDNSFITKEISSSMNEKIMSFLNDQSNSEGIQNDGDVSKLRFYTYANFIDVEYYFYFDILKRSKIDPYLKLKIEDIEEDKELIKKSLRSINKMNKIYNDYRSENIDGFKFLSGLKRHFNDILKNCLFANTTDLSQEKDDQDRSDPQFLLDERDEWFEYMTGQSPIGRVDILVDNCGLELINDIVLGYSLIKYQNVETVYFHLNTAPVFVSDAVKDREKGPNDNNVHDRKPSLQGDDIDRALAQIWEENRDLYHELIDLRESGAIRWCCNTFWNLPILFSNMPRSIYGELGGSSLFIVKGDINYRRLVGDRAWNVHASTKKVEGYLPCPTLVVRSLKSSVAMGLPVEKVKSIREQHHGNDDEWMTSGDYGMIQFFKY